MKDAKPTNDAPIREYGYENTPRGFILIPEFLTASEERDLLTFIRSLEFRTLQMHGVTAKRRIKQYGWHYAFESYRLTATEPIPDEFEDIKARSAVLAGIDASQWAEVLVTEYSRGAGIGWHRDAPVFGIVAGVSLGAACRMRFQTGVGAARRTHAIELPGRSIYLLTGEARTTWQHMIPSTRDLRYSITLRTLRNPKYPR